ncbi:MAG: carboxypeptidase regulatory-like domain-containing protein [Terriglobales bacterium]
MINQAGKPLSSATVAMLGNNRTPTAPLPPAYSTTSDANGAFSFPDVEPNTYRLFAQRTGYLEFVFANPDGTVVIPMAQGDRKSIEVKMTPQSFISGRITDADGEPFPGAMVTVFRVNRMNGTRQRASNPVPAGADGSFSIGNLMAGRYYLAAASPPSMTQTNQREVRGNNGGDERYVTTYYPDAVDASAASPIEVAPGAELRSIDIRLRKARVFHLYGKVVNAAGASLPSAMLTLRDPSVSDPLNANRISVVEGNFAINGLLPGAYSLQAQSGPTRELQGHLVVTITDRDIDDAIVTLTPALEIPLSVRIDDADPQQSQKLRRALRFTLTATDGTNDNAMAQTKADGWLFRTIGLGTYRMGLDVPDGTYVKSIRFGNQDITTGLLDTTSGGGALEMVLSPHAAEVTGIVQDANGQPLSGVIVTLWMPGLQPFGTLDQARSTGTDAMGHFRFGNLRPGEYRIAAWEKIEQGLGNVAEFHVKFDNKATVVRLAEDSRETVQPVLIHREEIETEAAKLHSPDWF